MSSSGTPARSLMPVPVAGKVPAARLASTDHPRGPHPEGSARRGNVADRVISSIIPPPPIHQDQSITPLPTAFLAHLSADSSISYSVARVDDSGAISAMAALTSLKLLPGDSIEYIVESEIILVRQAIHGLYLVPKKKNLVLPSKARRLCGIERRQQLLLAAIPAHRTLLIYPRSAINTMLDLYHSQLPEEHRTPN